MGNKRASYAVFAQVEPFFYSNLSNLERKKERKKTQKIPKNKSDYVILGKPLISYRRSEEMIRIMTRDPSYSD